jgi:hypothetical protein
MGGLTKWSVSFQSDEIPKRTNPIGNDLLQALRERLRRHLAVHMNTTVLGQRVPQGERIELHVCVPMCEPLQERGDNIPRAGPRLVYRACGAWCGTHPCSPSSFTLSQRLRMNSQFSLVRFSSVVLAWVEERESVAVKGCQDDSAHRQYHRKDSLARLET